MDINTYNQSKQFKISLDIEFSVDDILKDMGMSFEDFVKYEKDIPLERELKLQAHLKSMLKKELIRRIDNIDANDIHEVGHD